MNYARPINTKGQKPVVSTEYSSTHPGIDYAYPEKTPVYAAADGVVDYVVDDEKRQWIANTPTDPFRILPQIRRLNNADYGNNVLIQHDDGSKTLYAHLQYKSIVVKKGQRVVKGQLIGYVGSTGNSTGNHLHFEIKKYGAYVDPTKVIDASFTNYGAVAPQPTQPPMNTDRRPYWFDRMNTVTFKKPQEKVTDTEVEQFIKDYPGQIKRSGEFDKMCRALGISGDTNIVTAEILLSVAKEKFQGFNEKTVRADERAKTIVEVKQNIIRALNEIA